MSPLDQLIAVVAVAAALTPALCARPRYAIPGGLAATLAWLTASAYATGRTWGFVAVLCLVMAMATAAYVIEAAFTVAARERARHTETSKESAR